MASVPNHIHTCYVRRREKVATSCGFPLNDTSTANGIFDGGYGVFVAKKFRYDLSILSSLREYGSSEVFVVANMMFVEMIVVDFLWSTSSAEQFIFSESPIRLSFVSNFQARRGDKLAKTGFLTEIVLLL